LDQAHNDILSSQRALYKPQTLKRYISHRLSSESSNVP